MSTIRIVGSRSVSGRAFGQVLGHRAGVAGPDTRALPLVRRDFPLILRSLLTVEVNQPQPPRLDDESLSISSSQRPDLVLVFVVGAHFS
jgi:hypothetical protein